MITYALTILTNIIMQIYLWLSLNMERTSVALKFPYQNFSISLLQGLPRTLYKHMVDISVLYENNL
jgi:hypothetical protein